ncbi:hypothetical protein R1flu_022418 [Riccia fluitans]|uniref:Uncharacterized protein n=1 Tax=Riccia fluitans TaxID=41844 RepID=A0ABD1ZT15_9MARC
MIDANAKKEIRFGLDCCRHSPSADYSSDIGSDRQLSNEFSSDEDESQNSADDGIGLLAVGTDRLADDLDRLGFV